MVPLAVSTRKLAAVSESCKLMVNVRGTSSEIVWSTILLIVGVAPFRLMTVKAATMLVALPKLLLTTTE